jgi:glutamate dehydrogenase (NAD(P)+)
VVFCLEAVLERLGSSVEGKRVAVQGFGKVGAVVAHELFNRGAVIVALGDVSGGVVEPAGLDVPALLAWSLEEDDRFIRDWPAGEKVGRMEMLETPCDILIPAALERQIDGARSQRLQCQLVVEAANGPTTPDADAILAERGITVVPDVLANAGGVTVSYFEWVQDQQKLFWRSDEVAQRLKLQMHTALARVVATAERLGVDWRTAALSVAVERVAEAARLRGIYP